MFATLFGPSLLARPMVRGHAKAVSQDKHNAKMADKAKSVKRDSNEASNLQSTANVNVTVHSKH